MSIRKRFPNTVRLFCCFSMYGLLAISEATAQTHSIEGSVSIVDSNGNAVSDRSDVVVFIDGLPTASQVTQPKPPHLMSHKNKIFSPAVLPILRGELLDFFNDDDIFHNVFSLSRVKPFDLGIYPAGTSKLVSFPEAGLVKIYCNIHPEMVSTILILNNSFFAKTDSEGNFRIPGLPEGDYIARVWHEFSDVIQLQLSVRDGEQSTMSIELVETKKRVQHRNKFGMPYREKY